MIITHMMVYGTIKEKEKLFDQLVVSINETRKGLRHNILLPMDLIKEETITENTSHLEIS